MIERPPSVPSDDSSSATTGPTAWGWRSIFLAFVLGAVATGVGMWLLLWPEDSPPRVVRTSIEVPPEHAAREAVLSPDGARLVHVGQVDGRPRLVLRELDTYATSVLAGTEGASQPFFSPDGTRIGFLADEEIRAVTLADGHVETLGDAPIGTAGVSWSPDGTLVVASPSTGGLTQLDPTDDETIELTRPDAGRDELTHGWPLVSTDGTRVVFTVARRDRATRLAVLSLDGSDAGEWTHLFPATGRAHRLDDHTLVYQLDSDLIALEVDPATLEARGSPVTVVAGVAGSATDHGGLGSSTFSVGGDGTLSYVPFHAGTNDNRLVWVDRQGRVTPISSRRARHRHPRLSPDGQLIAVAAGSPRLGGDVWIHDVATDTRRPLTERGSDNRAPVWSPDGRAVAFASNREGPQTIFRRSTTGQVDAIRVTGGGDAQNPASWSPVGRVLAFYRVLENGNRDIWTIAPDVEAEVYLATSANERSPALSPDGRLLAYVSDETGRDGVHVRPYPEGGDGAIATFEGAVEPVWSRDAGTLFVWRGDALVAVAVRVESDDVVFSEPEPLFERRFVRDPGSNLPNYDVGADGRFVMIEPADPPTAIRVVTGWTSEVRNLLNASR